LKNKTYGFITKTDESIADSKLLYNDIPYLVYSKLKEHENKLNDHTNQIQILKTMNAGSNKSGDGGLNLDGAMD